MVNNEISYRKILRLLAKKWLTLSLSMTIGLLAAQIYLKFTPQIFQSSTSLKFEERRSELSELTNIRNLYDRTNRVESEKQIIKSKIVITKALRSLNYGITFYNKRIDVFENQYPKEPLKIEILDRSPNYIKTIFTFQEISDRKFRLLFQDGKGIRRSNIYTYGDIINHPQASFKIVKGREQIRRSKEVSFQFNEESELIERITHSLKIDDQLNVNVLTLSICDRNRHFASDILNAIASQYLNYDRRLRQSSADQTEKSINEMLKKLAQSRENSKSKIEKFRLTNPIVENNEVDSKISLLETDLKNAKIKELRIRLLHKKLISAPESLNLGLSEIDDPQLTFLINRFNDAINLKEMKLGQFAPSNPIILEAEKQIKYLKNIIEDNLINKQQDLDVLTNYLTREINIQLANVQQLPVSEGQYLELKADHSIQQKINSYLEEKKLEAQIAKSAITPGAAVIDYAHAADRPISPITLYVYLNSALLFLALAIFIILYKRLNNQYIYNETEISERTEIPIIGLIRFHKSSTDHPIPSITLPRSPFSESIRGLRSNLHFMNTEERSKIIYISSEISGEGKSFIALNLATALARSDKKVILIAADLRKPSLHDLLDINYKNGLSNYLSGQTNLPEIIKTTSIENLDFIPCGSIPPNPSELLLSHRMTDLIKDCRQHYEFTIIDSAPIGLVSDGKPLLKAADITLFVLRSGLSKHGFIATAERIRSEFEIRNIAFILNGFREDHMYTSIYKGEYPYTKKMQYQYITQQPSEYPNYFEI